MVQSRIFWGSEIDPLSQMPLVHSESSHFISQMAVLVAHTESTEAECQRKSISTSILLLSQRSC